MLLLSMFLICHVECREGKKRGGGGGGWSVWVNKTYASKLELGSNKYMGKSRPNQHKKMMTPSDFHEAWYIHTPNKVITLQ